MPPSPRFLALQDALGDRFVLERELGRGGMGAVWLARDLRLDRPVALKILHDDTGDAAARERLLREARTAARLAHPHIVPIYGIEERGALIVLVMGYVDGETLGARVQRRGPLAPDQVERLVREVGWALAYAHSCGVLHRDLTAANILLEHGTGRALLVDFGLAEVIADETGTTHERLGTPGYVAPEVIRGEPAVPASDLYGLGAVAWLALTGTAPFAGATTNELLAKHLVQPVPPLPTVARGASRRLVEAIRACLAKQVDERPADVAALLARLDRAAPTVAVAPALQEWFTRWVRFRPIYGIAAPVLGLQLWALVQSYFQRGGAGLVVSAAASTALTLLVLPIAGQLGAEIVSLRRLAAHGFGIGDIRAAWDHWTGHLRDLHRSDTLPPLHGRVILDLTVVGVATLLIGGFIAVFVLPFLMDAGEVHWTRVALWEYASWIVLGTSAGLGVSFLSPGLRARPDGWFRRMTERFWRGRLGGLTARLAQLGRRGTAAVSATLHRNTELVLGLAIEQLWGALPRDERSAFGDVPATATALQHGAEELRAMLGHLTTAQAALPEDASEHRSLGETVEAVRAQHRQAVSALETLRLQMLRAVSSRSVTAELGHEIAAAREAEQALVHGLAGLHETRAAIGRAARRSMRALTPTPTPS